MSKFLDQMLRAEAADVQKNLPTAKYEIKRLSRALGEPVALELRALPYGKAQELRDMERDQEVHILLAGCPELKDEGLTVKFGGVTPVETVKTTIFPSLIITISSQSFSASVIV